MVHDTINRYQQPWKFAAAEEFLQNALSLPLVSATHVDVKLATKARCRMLPVMEG